MQDEKYSVYFNGVHHDGDYSLTVIFDWLFYKHKIAVENDAWFSAVIIDNETGEIVYTNEMERR